MASGDQIEGLLCGDEVLEHVQLLMTDIRDVVYSLLVVLKMIFLVGFVVSKISSEVTSYDLRVSY